MPLPTTTVNEKIRVMFEGNAFEWEEEIRSSDAVASFSRQIVSVTAAYENVPLGEVAQDHCNLWVRHLGNAGAVLLTIDAIKPSGFGYVKVGQTVRMKIGEGLATLEMIMLEDAGPHNVEVIAWSGVGA